MTLNGSVRGSAVVSCSDEGAAVTLSVRGLPAETSLFYAWDGGVGRTDITGETILIPETDVCALALVKDGRIVAAGFSGECAANRGRILDAIRITAAEEPEKKPEPPKKPSAVSPAKKAPRAGTPTAAVTEGILRRAELLFSALGNNAPVPMPEEVGGTPVPNPFPRSFPGTEWRKKDGDHRLFGEKNVGGVKKSYIAVPVDMKRAGALSRGRVIVSKDGRRFLVEQIL